MQGFNLVVLGGNLTRDPELRHLPNNTPLSEFGLAINEMYTDKDGNKKESVHYVDCVAFGRNAENIHKFFTKGKPIFLQGRLKFEQWEDRESGQKRNKLKVNVETWRFGDFDSSRSQQGSRGGHGGRSRGGDGFAGPSKGHESLEDNEIPF